MALSVGFRILVSQMQSCYPSYGAPTITPVGLTPTERASLRWTHNGDNEYISAYRAATIFHQIHLIATASMHSKAAIVMLRLWLHQTNSTTSIPRSSPSSASVPTASMTRQFLA